MAITAETRNDIIELVVTAYNAAPSTTLLTELVAIVDGGGTLADVANNLTSSATWKSLYPTFQTADEFATEWLGKLVPEASAEALAEGKTVVTGLINGGSSFGAIVLQAQTFLSATADTDASFGTSVKVFDNKTAVATHYAVTKEQDGNIDAGSTALAGVTSDAATVTTAKATIDGDAASNTGSTATLSTSVDTVNGTAGDDTFKGVVSNTATSNTLGAGDTLDGLAGTDNLEIVFDGSGSLGPVTTISNVENFFLKNFGTQANTANLANITGIAQVWNDGSTQAVNVTNLGSIPTIGIRNTTVDTDITFTNAAVAGSADSVTVLLDGVNNTATDVTLGATSGTEGVETVVVNSSGSAANRLNSLNSDQADFTTLTLTGTQALTLDSVDSTLTKIDASALGGKLTATISAATSAKDVSFIGSKNDDAITVGTTTNADTIDGGDGTDSLTSAGTFGATVSSVEALTLLVAGSTTPSADFDKAQSISTVTVGSSGSTADFNALNFTNMPANPTINLASNSVNTLNAASTLSLKTSTGSADSVTLNFSGNGSFEFLTKTVSVAGIETINIGANSAGDLKISKADLFAQTTDVIKKIVITGSSKVDVDQTLTGATTAIEIDASGLTGVLDMAAASAPGGAVTLKAGSGNDILQGSASADTITTGGGNNTVATGNGGDTVTASSGNDTITGGTGADTLTAGGGNDSVTGGAGKDTISFGSGTVINVIAADGDTGTFTAPTGTSVSTTGFDVVSGLGAGDDIQINSYTTAAATGAADNVFDSDGTVTSSDLSAVALEANSLEVVRGTYSASANSFTESATGDDALFVFDSDATQGATSAEAIVLVGAGARTFTVAAGSTTTIDIT